MSRTRRSRARAETAAPPADDGPSFMATQIHGRYYDLARQIFEYGDTVAVSEEIAQHLAGAADRRPITLSANELAKSTGLTGEEVSNSIASRERRKLIRREPGRAGTIPRFSPAAV